MRLKRFIGIVTAALFICVAVPVFSADRDGEIAAFADKAIAHVKDVGRERAYKDFSDRGNAFIKGEVYVVTLDLEGLCLSHAMNPRLIGKNFLNFRDTAGKLFIREIVNNIGKQGYTWVEYNWVNPITKKIALKRAIAKMIDDKEYVIIGYWP